MGIIFKHKHVRLNCMVNNYIHLSYLFGNWYNLILPNQLRFIAHSVARETFAFFLPRVAVRNGVGYRDAQGVRDIFKNLVYMYAV